MPPHAREVAGGAPVAESPRGVAAGDSDGILSWAGTAFHVAEARDMTTQPRDLL